MTQDANVPATIPAYLDVRAFVDRSLRRWKVAAGIVCAMGCLAVAVALILPNKYSCTTKIVFQGGGSALGGSLGTLASLAGIEGGASSSDPSMYFQDVALSTGLLQSILQQEWKASKYFADTSRPFLLREFWEIDVDSSEPGWENALRESLQRRLVKGGYLEVEKDAKTGVITVATRFEDPLLSHMVNRFVVDQANDILVNKMSTSAGANRKFIEARLVAVKKDLSDAENELRMFLQNNRVRNAPEQQVQESRLERNLQVNQEVFLQLVKQLEMAKIDEARDLPVLDVIDQPLVPVEKAGPKRKLIVLAGLFLGLVAGFVIAGVLDFYLEDRKGFLGRVQLLIAAFFGERQQG